LEKVVATKTLLPVNLNGDTFSKTTSYLDPAPPQMVWDGTYDKAVGHKAPGSLRIDGPGSVNLSLFQYAVEQYAQRWWVHGWYRAENVRGRGVYLRVKYSYAREPQEQFYLGGLGTQPWTYFSFITTALRQRDCSDLAFELDGPGQVWLDEVALTALKEGENPQVTTVPVPAGLKPSTDCLIDLRMTEQPSKAVYDESRNGHALYLNGPTWMQEDGRGFLRFDGVDDSAIIPLKAALEPRDAPSDATGYNIYKSTFRLDTFTFEWWVRPRRNEKMDSYRMYAFAFYATSPQLCFVQQRRTDTTCRLTYRNDFWHHPISFETSVPFDQWAHITATHGDGKVVLYMNGQQVGEESYDAHGPGFYNFAYHWQYDVGSFLERGNFYIGDIGPIRLLTRALTPDEVKEQYLHGWPKAGQ
jgi:hypothetical protein